MSSKKSDADNSPIQFKVVAFGDASTGKTSTLLHLVYEEYNRKYQATVVIEYYCFNFEINHNKYQYRIYDLAGSKNTKTNFVANSYLDSDGINNIFIAFFDVTSAKKTIDGLLERANNISKKINPDKSKKIPLILVGAKADNDLVIDASVSNLAENAKKQLEELGFELITGDKPYIPVSAQDNKGIHDDLLNALNQAAKIEPENIIESTNEIHQGGLAKHPRAKMALAVTGLVLGIAAIATVTVLTCGVAGVLGAAAAAIAATLTLHASLTIVSIVAGGVGLFATSAIAKCAHVIHNTKSKPPTL